MRERKKKKEEKVRRPSPSMFFVFISCRRRPQQPQGGFLGQMASLTLTFSSGGFAEFTNAWLHVLAHQAAAAAEAEAAVSVVHDGAAPAREAAAAALQSAERPTRVLVPAEAPPPYV